MHARGWCTRELRETGTRACWTRVLRAPASARLLRAPAARACIRAHGRCE